MKKLLIGFGLVLLSCNSNSHKKETVVEMGSNKEIKSVEICNCDSLLKNEEGLMTLNQQPFTGICELYYPNSSTKYMSQQLLDGEVNGSIFYYDKDGNVILEEEYVKGKKIGEKDEILHVNCKELVAKENEREGKIYYYSEKPFTGSCEDYYPNSDQVYLVSNYKNGKLNGYTTYFNKDGSVLIMNKYENNNIVSEFTTSMSEIEK